MIEDNEITIKVSHNGYFYTFKDLVVHAEIRIEHSEKHSSVLLLQEESDKKGRIDITNLLHTFLHHMKENEGKEVRLYLTTFTRKMEFDENLLKTPIPKEFLDMFKISKGNQ